MGEADELFDMMDIDKDGRISMDECFSHFALRQVNLPENTYLFWDAMRGFLSPPPYG